MAEVSSTNIGVRKSRLRNGITDFLQARLQARLDKLEADDPKRHELIAQFQPEAWLADAARRVRQIQAVTHALKPIHPDARGTNLYVEPSRLPSHDLVGSHVLGEDFVSDVVGNAAALDVYKLLRLEVDGISLLDGLQANDPAAVQALSDDPAQAAALQEAFATLTHERETGPASHVLAKQLYWLLGGDATDDGQYHLLAPLYATSLAHAVHEVLQEARFGESNKAAREARRTGQSHDGILHHYSDLAVRKLGGTKPQNVSQLNSERGGLSYLLASLPPQWSPQRMQPPWGATSVFDRILLRQEGVRPVVQAFLGFLRSDPPANLETRRRVDAYVDRLIDELVTMAGEIQQACPAGWTADHRCILVREEQLWLDPKRAECDEEFYREWLAMAWPDSIGHRFGNWLNAQLQQHLPVGEVEQRHWRKELLLDESEGGWAQHLHALRKSTAAQAPSEQGV